jgi:hypothetical protein
MKTLQNVLIDIDSYNVHAVSYTNYRWIFISNNNI